MSDSEDEYPEPNDGEGLTSYRCRCIGWERRKSERDIKKILKQMESELTTLDSLISSIDDETKRERLQEAWENMAIAHRTMLINID